MEYPIRINKYLRDTGFPSRREADRLVEAGLVFINGKRAENGMMVNEKDQVTVKDEKKQYEYLSYYKPYGLATQSIDEVKRNGLSAVPELDKESEGLLILTNDRKFIKEVLSGNKKYEKEYVVSVREHLRAGILPILKSGMQTKDFGKLPSIKAEIINGTTLRIILNEERGNQIRIMFGELHSTVVSIKRVRIGDIRLGNLKPGESRLFIPNK